MKHKSLWSCVHFSMYFYTVCYFKWIRPAWMLKLTCSLDSAAQCYMKKCFHLPFYDNLFVRYGYPWFFFFPHFFMTNIKMAAKRPMWDTFFQCYHLNSLTRQINVSKNVGYNKKSDWCMGNPPSYYTNLIPGSTRLGRAARGWMNTL